MTIQTGRSFEFNQYFQTLPPREQSIIQKAERAYVASFARWADAPLAECMIGYAELQDTGEELTG